MGSAYVKASTDIVLSKACLIPLGEDLLKEPYILDLLRLMVDEIYQMPGALRGFPYKKGKRYRVITAILRPLNS